VQPNFAYFGRKDAQQSRLITQMAARLESRYGNCGLPTGARAGRVGAFLAKRLFECGGAARRHRLHRALGAAKSELATGVRDALHLQAVLQRTLAAERAVRVDYAEIVMPKRLIRSYE